MNEERVDLSKIEESVRQLKQELSKMIVGQQDMIELLIIALFSKGHVLLEGLPGLAKTLTAKALAKSLRIDFKRIQFTPDLLPSDILGVNIYNTKSTDFEFKPGPIFSQMILIDEINRAPAKSQAALFEVMEERQITIDGKEYQMQSPFMIVATQNPIDFEGTYRLPEAQMDRFMFRIIIGYPNLSEESDIIRLYHEMENKNDLSVIESVINSEDLLKCQELVGKVHVEAELMNFIASIVQKTRTYKDIDIGASPRASLAILSASKAKATIEGRDFITPDDVVFVAPHVMNHRISLSPEKEMEGVSPTKILEQLLQSVEVPR